MTSKALDIKKAIEENKELAKPMNVANAVHNVHVAQFAVMSRCLAQLDGVEVALKRHAAQNVENRQSKQMWLAVQKLIDSIELGKRNACCIEGRRLPLAQQIKTLESCSGNDEFMKTILSHIPKETLIQGEYTHEDLKTRFDKVYNIGSRVAHLNANGGGMIAHIGAWFKSLITFRVHSKLSPTEKIDPTVISNQELLDRAHYFMKKGDNLQAIKLLNCTQGPTKSIANGFIEDARRHEEALLLARIMVAHAAVTSIRTIY